MTANNEPPNTSRSTHAAEIESGQRFAFGANWARFLRDLNEARIAAAEASLLDMLGLSTLDGLRFLDAGSGSGLFSLAARRLGAQVVSFDFDPKSVACTRELRRRHLTAGGQGSDDDSWRIEAGSVLDLAYLAQLGTFDIVYSWGVLHHTGRLWDATDAVSRCVQPGGRLFIAVYNDQGLFSRWWTWVKRRYNRNATARVLLVVAYVPYFIGLRWLYRRLSGLGQVARGMSLWHDMIDWLGGYPFEVAKPEAVFDFVAARGFELRRLWTAGSTGACNEFVFQRRSTEGDQTKPSTSA